MGLGTAIVRWCATAGVSSLGYIYVQNQLPHGVLAVFREYGSLTHNNIRHLKGSESSRTSKKYLYGRMSFMFVITVKMQGRMSFMFVITVKMQGIFGAQEPDLAEKAKRENNSHKNNRAAIARCNWRTPPASQLCSPLLNPGAPATNLSFEAVDISAITKLRHHANTVQRADINDVFLVTNSS